MTCMPTLVVRHVCERAKATRGWHKRRTEPRYLRSWGDLATGNHLDGTDKFGNASLDGCTSMLSHWDFATRYIWAEPVKSKTQEDTTAAFRFIMENTKQVKLIYWDTHSALKASLKDLHILQ